MDKVTVMIVAVIMVFTLLAVMHLLREMWTGKQPSKHFYWFWVIIGIPIFGTLIYFSKNLNR